jgi:hypothetical protein
MGYSRVRLMISSSIFSPHAKDSPFRSTSFPSVFCHPFPFYAPREKRNKQTETAGYGGQFALPSQVFFQ